MNNEPSLSRTNSTKSLDFSATQKRIIESIERLIQLTKQMWSDSGVLVKKTLNLSAYKPELDGEILDYIFSSNSEFFAKIQTLSISGNPKITKLPKSISVLTRLEELDASSCSLAEISPLANHNIKAINIDNNPIDQAKFDQIGQSSMADGVERFFANGCGLENMDVFTGMRNIASLEVGNNPKIDTLPPGQKNSWKNLVSLKVNNCGIKELTEKFFESCPNLKTFVVKHNKLTTVGEGLGLVKKMEQLDLSENNITKIANKNIFLPFLSRLYLDKNDIRVLPNFLKDSRQLRVLSVENCNIESLEQVAELGNLEEFWINNNPINQSSFNEISKYLIHRSLQRFYASNCKLTNIDSISILRNLEVLVAKDNKIEAFPKNLGALKKLRYVNLGENAIKEIPREVASLNIQSLIMPNNQLRDLPAELAKLPLKKINLSSNELSDAMELQDGILSLDDVEVSNNKFTKIPNFIKKSTQITKLFARLCFIDRIDLHEADRCWPNVASFNLQGNPLIGMSDPTGKREEASRLSGTEMAIMTRMKTSTNSLTRINLRVRSSEEIFAKIRNYLLILAEKPETPPSKSFLFALSTLQLKPSDPIVREIARDLASEQPSQFAMSALRLIAHVNSFYVPNREQIVFVLRHMFREANTGISSNYPLYVQMMDEIEALGESCLNGTHLNAILHYPALCAKEGIRPNPQIMSEIAVHNLVAHLIGQLKMDTNYTYEEGSKKTDEITELVATISGMILSNSDNHLVDGIPRIHNPQKTDTVYTKYDTGKKILENGKNKRLALEVLKEFCKTDQNNCLVKRSNTVHIDPAKLSAATLGYILDSNTTSNQTLATARLIIGEAAKEAQGMVGDLNLYDTSESEKSQERIQIEQKILNMATDFMAQRTISLAIAASDKNCTEIVTDDKISKARHEAFIQALQKAKKQYISEFSKLCTSLHTAKQSHAQRERSRASGIKRVLQDLNIGNWRRQG